MWTMQPDDPGGESAPVAVEGPLDVGDGGLAADGGHVAFVEVVEGLVEAGAVAAQSRAMSRPMRLAA